MLQDLDHLMKARGIRAFIVPMHEANHASFRWLTRGAKVTRGYVVKVAQRDPFLIAYPMEREEAAATGIAVRSIHEFEYERIFRDATDLIAAYGAFFEVVLRENGVEGPVAFFGNAPLHLYLGIAELLESRGYPVVRGPADDLIQLARKRKEAWEIEAIRATGERTERVVDEVRMMLRSWHADLRIGDLKELVTREITRHGLVEDHETIVSHGRDAAIPHSRGDAGQRIRSSVPIVIDIFPADRSTGYFFDLTRTFCVGPIPEELRQIHADVLAAYRLARDGMRPGLAAAASQTLVCDFFEGKGYTTIRSNPLTTEGYVHSLGHGVGLDIHEKPSFSLNPSNLDMIEEGDVLTIEPGLYFPDREIGVRIEDTFVVRAEGVESLSVSPRDLEP